MDKDETWQVIHQQRAVLADLLETLTPAEWDHPSLCDGWSVRDVAAHAIGGPRVTIGQVAVTAVRARGNLDRMIHDVAKQLSARPTSEIVADYRRFRHSRRVAPGTTYRDALVDTLVHSQDISIPLGRHHEMPVQAAREAAQLVLRRRIPFHAQRRLAGYRLEATDIDWAYGQGTEIRGPMSALLLLLTGRPASLEHLTGEGVPGLRRMLGAEPDELPRT